MLLTQHWGFFIDKVCLFVYNVGGNIVSKNEYAYTEGMIEGEPTKTYNYSYGDAWKDQLTNFDGQSIVYDTCGNPTSYLGATLTWSRGRLLTRFTKGPSISHMTYDANGIRKSKLRVNHIATIDSSYIYDSNGRLRTETEGAYTRRYLYSSDGIAGYEENGERYFYRKNLFGDITAIYQGATKLAEYVYDAWGNCTVTYDTNGIGARNPMRYRGYYWDKDLKMYYLMTRYYDPKICRFINADSFEYLDPETFDEYTKIDFEESYNLLTNNCSHYVIAWLAQNYNGKLLSKEFFDTINLNPVPAISSAITSVAMAFSWVVNEIHGLWNKIVNR